MRIVILTDSLGRPRPELDESERTRYYDVYGYKLKQHFYDDEVELIYIGSLDTEDATIFSRESIAFREPDIVIYHMGINDCVPRVFNKNSKSILLNKYFRKITFNIFLFLIHHFRYFITKHNKKVYTSQDKFYTNFQEMIEEVKKYNPQAQFIAISMAYSTDKLTSRSYGINDNIKNYNSILEKIFGQGYIDINEISADNILISDGVHLTKEAHVSLANEIIKKISNMQ